MTNFIKKNELKNDWFLIDAENAVVGRLASYISKVLRLSLIHISEPTRPEPISYAVFCLKKKNVYGQYAYARVY